VATSRDDIDSATSAPTLQLYEFGKKKHQILLLWLVAHQFMASITYWSNPLCPSPRGMPLL
jgi:hypothetical protein